MTKIIVSEEAHKIYCQYCRQPKHVEEFYEKKIDSKRICDDCAIMHLEYTYKPTIKSMYVDSYLNFLESSTDPIIVYASAFKRSIRDGYFFTSDENLIPEELLNILWHIAKGGREIRFKNYIHLIRFIITYAEDSWSGKRSKIVSSILVQGLERQLSEKQRYVIQRTLKILLNPHQIPII